MFSIVMLDAWYATNYYYLNRCALLQLSNILLFFWFELVSSAEHYNLFAHQLQKELYPYQLTLLTSISKEIHHAKREFFVNVVNIVPLVNINLSEMKDNGSFTLSVHKNLRAIRTLIAIFQDTLNFSELQEYFKLITELYPMDPRPKCLLVLFNNVTSHDDYKTLFEHAWSLNFLEILIIQLHYDGTLTCMDYNPFLNAINQWTFNPDVKLFPTKLQNIHNYALKIPLFDYFPFVTAVVNEQSGNVKTGGYYNNYIDIFIERMNASVKYVDIETKRDNVTFVRRLINRDINLVTMPFMVGAYLYDKPVLRSRLFSTSKLVFVVPLLTESKLDFPFNLKMNFIYVIGLMLCIRFSAKVLKFSTKNWTTLEILQLLLGLPTTRKSWRTVAEKMVAFPVLLLSMMLSTILIANLTDVKLLKKELPLNTLNQINSSRLPIYVLDYYYTYFKDEFSDLRNHVEPVVNISACFEANLRGKHTICVASEFTATYYASTYREVPVKIVDPPIFVDFEAYIFERGSQYVETFNDILIRLTESGIPKSWLSEMRKNKLDLHEMLLSETKITTVLLLVLGSGFLFASIAFVVETVWHSRKL